MHLSDAQSFKRVWIEAGANKRLQLLRDGFAVWKVDDSFFDFCSQLVLVFAAKGNVAEQHFVESDA